MQIHAMCTQSKAVHNQHKTVCVTSEKKYVNSSIGRTKPLVYIKSKVNSEFLNDREAPNEFAKFYHSTYVKDNGILPDFQKLCNDVFDYIAFDIFEIKMCLNSLPSKLSCGPDNKPNVLLKKLSI